MNVKDDSRKKGGVGCLEEERMKERRVACIIEESGDGGILG